MSRSKVVEKREEKETIQEDIFYRFLCLQQESEYRLDGTVEETITKNGIIVKPDLITSPAFEAIQKEFSTESYYLDDSGLVIFG